MPRPNAACRFTCRSMTTSPARSNCAGSRLAAGNDSRIQSSAFMSTPRQVTSPVTSRAIVTGAYARRNSSIAVGSSAGAATSRRRSPGTRARCHSDDPIALHVVSMPAISSSAIVPTTWSAVSFCP